MSHNFIDENGFKVCTHCGETEEEHYWNKNQINEIKNRTLPIPIIKKHINNKWKRLLRMSTIFTATKSHSVYNEILCLINLLPLSSKIKMNLSEFIMKKNLRTTNEIYETVYKVICTLDLPITTTEYLEILHIDKSHRYKPLTKIDNIENIRKYYWYITKSVEKAKKLLNFSPEEAEKIEKITFNYYNLIRFKMLKSPNPIYLIQNLVYYTIREKLKPVQTQFNKTNFEITNFSFMSSLIKYLVEIKKSNLDSCFFEKLEISERNKQLEKAIA